MLVLRQRKEGFFWWNRREGVSPGTGMSAQAGKGGCWWRWTQVAIWIANGPFPKHRLICTWSHLISPQPTLAELSLAPHLQGWCLPYTQQVLFHEIATRASTTNHGRLCLLASVILLTSDSEFQLKQKLVSNCIWEENGSVFSIFANFQGPPLTIATIFLIMQWCQNIPSELAGRRHNCISFFGNKHSVCEASTTLEDRTTAPPVGFLRTILWFSQHSVFPPPQSV